MVTGHGRLERAVRLWLPVGFFLVLALFPFYWMAITSIKPNAELYNRNVMPLIVHAPTLKHYIDLLAKTAPVATTVGIGALEHVGAKVTDLTGRLAMELWNHIRRRDKRAEWSREDLQSAIQEYLVQDSQVQELVAALTGVIDNRKLLSHSTHNELHGNVTTHTFNMGNTNA